MARLQKSYIILASAHLVMDALTNAEHIEHWSDSEAIMLPEAGARFSLWNGTIVGVNLEVGDGRIVQQWKESQWPDFSWVLIELSEESGVTRVRLTHEDIPDDAFESIDEGWDEYYFLPLKRYIEEQL